MIMKERICNKVFAYSFLFTALFALPYGADAAELFLTPPSGVFETGETVTIDVMLDPGEHSVNAAEGEVVIPDGMEVRAIHTEGSVFTLWTEEPSLSNGRVFFAGGRSGEISGNAEPLFTLEVSTALRDVLQVRMASGAVLAADGAGTNVISALTSGTYTFISAPEEREPEAEFVASPGAPDAPHIESATHPSEDDWYQDSDPSFSWSISDDVEEVRAELNQRPSAVPQEIQRSATDSLSFDDVLDGEWYFHLQLRNESGWSDISSRRVRIDTTPPERFTIDKRSRGDRTDPMASFDIDVSDAVSGMRGIEFFIDGVYEEVVSGAVNEATIGPLPPGVHTLIARAVNNAGVRRTETLTVEVDPIERPRFTEIPSIVHSGSIFALRGEALPDSTVVISLERRGEEAELFETRAESDGSFIFVAPRKPEDGIYTVRAKAVDERGAQSEYSDSETVAVEAPGIIRIGSLVIDTLAVVISLAALIGLSVFGVYWSRHKWIIFRKRLDKEIYEAEEEVHEAFSELKEKAAHQLSLLRNAQKQRELTEEEKAIMEDLKISLTDIEERVEKEVHDIEEELDRYRS